MDELRAAIAECDRVLAVFWSPTPLSRTHARYLAARRELELRLLRLQPSVPPNA